MQQIIDSVLECDKLKAVTRKNKPIGLTRFENPAEHSWQIALLAWSLAPYAPVPLDMNRVVRMLLVHDIGEIDTGDTIVFANIDWEQAKQQEYQAVTRIFGLLPRVQADEFLQLWQEFEQAQTPEARFAYAIDRAMPVLLNLANNGQSWRENHIRYEQVIERIEAPVKAGCPQLWDYLLDKLNDYRAQGWCA